ncbi:metalloprotease [Ectothiorhodospiraceae bacterium BW-2]|nr:metalloprotease [Ectothiorhodospiraceae bacterium BW-2]
MGYRIELRPSGHIFEAEANEPLLEAALRAGIHVNYHCSSGSCGECIARRIEGEVVAHGGADFRLNLQQQAQGDLLLCRHTAASNLVLELQELNHPASIPKQQIATRVYRLEQIEEQFLILQLRTPRSQTLQFMAGQAVELSLDSGESYVSPIASCPCNGMILQFHLPCYINNSFIAAMADIAAAKRLKVNLVGPLGTITLVEQQQRPLLFIAIDHGFAAIKGPIEQALKLDLPQPVLLYRIATLHRPHYLENYCRAWEDQFEEYHHIELDQAGEGLDSALIKQIVQQQLERFGSIREIDCYVGADSEATGVIERCWLKLGGGLERLFPLTDNCSST